MAAALTASLLTPAFAQRLHVAPADAKAQAILAPASEPGTRLVVSGRVLDEDGRPIGNASMYVYQTDARGEYIPGQSGGSDRPRLYAYLRTGADGRYSFTTIQPGSYPNSRNPAHIHFEISAGERERVYEIVFAGDPHIDERFEAQARQPFGGVVIVRTESAAGGALRATHDVRVKERMR